MSADSPSPFEDSAPKSARYEELLQRIRQKQDEKELAENRRHRHLIATRIVGLSLLAIACGALIYHGPMKTYDQSKFLVIQMWQNYFPPSDESRIVFVAIPTPPPRQRPLVINRPLPKPIEYVVNEDEIDRATAHLVKARHIVEITRKDEAERIDLINQDLTLMDMANVDAQSLSYQLDNDPRLRNTSLNLDVKQTLATMVHNAQVQSSNEAVRLAHDSDILNDIQQRLAKRLADEHAAEQELASAQRGHPVIDEKQ